MKKATRSILSTVLAVSMAATACPVSFAATTSNEVTAREKANAALAREAAAQGMVLLENKNNSLPIKTKKLALFGGGAVRTVRGGTGSGDPFNGGLSGGGDVNVNQSERYNINIYNSFKKAGYDITTASILEKYAEGYDVENAKAASNPMATFAYPELTFTDEELAASAKDTNTAVYVISRNAGEGADRGMTKKVTVNEVEYELGDYELSDVEKENLKKVASAFENTIVVLNVGGVIDTKFFEETEGLDSLLLMGQGGQEGGNALLDVVTGAVTPSGKLTDTWAENYSDYPASATFAKADGDSMKEWYKEGIYVGYRYFDTFGIKPAYEFGYGLSYTNFDINVKNVSVNEDKVTVKAEVTNTGKTYSGKEVVQVYFSAPDSKDAEKEYQQLAAYGKTDELAPGESQVLTLTYDTDEMAYYSEEKASYILDPGTYYVRVGDSSRNTKVAAAIKLNQSAVTEVLSNQMEVPESENLTEWSKAGKTPYTYATEQQEMAEAPVFTLDASKVKTENNVSEYKDEKVTTYTTDPDYKAVQDYEKVEVVTDKKGATLKDVVDNKVTMGEFVAQMSLEELAKLNCGSGWGVANENTPIVGSNSATVPGAAGETLTYDQYGIPSIVLADGPGGIRVKQKYEAKNVETGETATYYQYCTAWPVDFVLAQSWDTDLLKRIGEAFGKELEEMNITILLGPSLNIHRDPLCGRNFEYFSEDPVISGTMASAITLGVQEEPGVGACLKHFSANNQETDRSGTDSIVSERALREIYLKGFEIAVKEAQPWSIMTSYNFLNGIETSENKELLTNITRGEWGYEGIFMTDWGNNSNHAREVLAGNDVKMPSGSPETLKAALKKGILKRSDLEDCAERLVKMIMKVNIFKEKILNPVTVDIGDDTYFKAAENILWSQTARAENTSDEDGGKDLGYCDAGAWTQYQINVAKSGTYSLSARSASNAGGGAFDILADGTKIASFKAVNTGGWQKWTTLEAQQIKLEAGVHTLRIEFTESGSNLNWLHFVRQSEYIENLEKLYQAWASQDLSEYTAESAETMRTALAAAKAVLDKENATDSEIQAAIIQMTQAINAMEYGTNKVHLEAIIEVAEKTLANPGDYADVSALEAAVKAGKEILAKPDATQEEANAAANAIADSMQALMERADIRSLRELTDAANELLEKNSGKYTDDTAKALQDAVAHAEEILGKDGKSDAEIKEAYNQIMDAIVGLKMKGNKAALEAMIKKAESILAENSRYVADTIEGLDEELAAAKAVYENNQALQSEVNEAVKSLTFKIAEARLLGDVDGDGQITTNDTVEILRAAAEIATLSAEDAASADVNGDGVADTADAVLVLQYASEAVSGF